MRISQRWKVLVYEQAHSVRAIPLSGRFLAVLMTEKLIVSGLLSSLKRYSFPYLNQNSLLLAVSLFLLSLTRLHRRANVEVQPYAFTTKSLLVGHTDYKYLRWQVIDTPGILDHPLEDRNTIEMQAITAMAHLRCTILYFLDISEQCGYSLRQQCELFHSIMPLFANKPLVITMNKIDVRRPEDLRPDERALIEQMVASIPGCVLLPMSSLSEEGVTHVKETACDMLLALRTEMKMKGVKKDEIAHRLHVAMPEPRDQRERPACTHAGKFCSSNPALGHRI